MKFFKDQKVLNIFIFQKMKIMVSKNKFLTYSINILSPAKASIIDYK